MADTLTLEGLTIQAGTSRLVENVSVTLESGRLLGLVGASGSGKTLTARALLGLVDMEPGLVAGRLTWTGPDEERTLFDGRTSAADLDRRFAPLRGSLVGYLHQHARQALDPLWTVGRAVTEAAVLAGRDPDPRPWLERAGFRDPDRVARIFPHQLSGGMAQRAVIAQALARGSRFLLADEPTTGLDPTVQQEILDEFRRLRDTGMGLLLITHDLRLLPGVADEVGIVHQGQLLEWAAPEDLLAGKIHSAAARELVEATRLIAGIG